VECIFQKQPLRNRSFGDKTGLRKENIGIVDIFQEFLLMAENISMSASYLIIQIDMVA
jgi:hypothetical protein